MTIVYPPASLRATERFDHWQEVVCSTYVKTINRTLTDQSFEGLLEISDRGSILFSRIKSLPIEYERLGHDDGDSVFVSLSFCSEAYVTQNGIISKQLPGEIVFYDSRRPYLCHFPSGDDQIVLTIPHALLFSHFPKAEQYLGRTLPGQTVLGGLARTMLMDVWKAGNHLPTVTSERLNSALLDVLASAFETSFSSAHDYLNPRQQSHMERVKNFIRAHLHDPDLSVTHIAAATYVSASTLHRLFAAEGTTVMRWLWSQRLQACHSALLKGRFTTVSDAAITFGFTNLSHFSRVFKQTYGVSPQTLMKK